MARSLQDAVHQCEGNEEEWKKSWPLLIDGLDDKMRSLLSAAKVPENILNNREIWDYRRPRQSQEFLLCFIDIFRESNRASASSIGNAKFSVTGKNFEPGDRTIE